MENNKFQWREGDYTVTRTIAWSGPGCHEGCGVLVYTQGNKVLKVEGDPSNPHNQGRLCPRCLSVREAIHHPDRILYPMRRAGARGENKWERISWDEALDEVAARFNDIKEKYGPESVIFCRGTDRDEGSVARLAYSLGSPNEACLGLSGNSCYLPRVAEMLTTTGDVAVADCSQQFADRYDNPEYRRPELLVIWGNNPLVSNSDGFYGHWVVDLMKQGTKLLVIDPRLTWLASRAEMWLQIRPGTDGALALGMLNVIINEGLYDKEFVDKWTYGFDKLKDRVQEYSPARVAEITWIPEETIIKAARLYAKSKPAAIQWGLAIDQTQAGVPAAQAIGALWTITGNLDVPGGNIIVRMPYNIIWPWLSGWGYDELLTDEQRAKRVGPNKYPLFEYGFLITQSDMMVDQMLSGEPYPIKAAWLQTQNPLANMSADPQKMYQALSKLEFVAVADLFMTPTIQAVADIVLPAASWVERDSLRAVWYHLGAINKLIQVGEAKGDYQIQLELGKRLNPAAWPWNSEEEVVNAELVPSGLTFKELRDDGPHYPVFQYRKYEKGLLTQDGEPGFNTPTGKVELVSTMFEDWGYDPLPYFEEPKWSPVSTPQLAKEYPLILATGARSWVYFHSENRQQPTNREIHPNPRVEINPETAQKYGLKQGDWAWIENPIGRARMEVQLNPAINTHVVSADHGWWFPEKPAAEPSLYGVWESNINQLIPMAPGDTGFGAPYKSSICKIYKAEEV